MGTMGRRGMALIMATIMALVTTGMTGGRMIMSSDITITGRATMILADEGSGAAVLGVVFVEVFMADFTEEEDSVMVAGTEAEGAVMADDSQNTEIL
jgi:hypothetical protein